MTLLVGNEDIARVLTPKLALDAVWRAYTEFFEGEAICRPRIDIRIPTSDPRSVFQFGTMEGGSTSGYFAIRMKSDIVFETEYGGTRTREWYNTRPGKFCGLVLLFGIENGELLAIMNDGVIQHMRMGADAGIGARAMARDDARVVGMIGSGGMARSGLESLALVRPIERVHVYSPTVENREAYSKEMADRLGIEVVAVGTAEDAHRDADILVDATDAVIPTIAGRWVEPGAHIICLGSGGPDDEAAAKIDKALLFGRAPTPLELPAWEVRTGLVSYVARPEDTLRRSGSAARGGVGGGRIRGLVEEDMIVFTELLNGTHTGRTSDDEITLSERGHLQGIQFFPLAGAVYERARADGLGRELPTDWFLQDIRN